MTRVLDVIDCGILLTYRSYYNTPDVRTETQNRRRLFSRFRPGSILLELSVPIVKGIRYHDLLQGRYQLARCNKFDIFRLRIL